jgi:Flp pilus assembly protein TadB
MDTIQLAGILFCIFAFGGMGLLLFNFSRDTNVSRQSTTGMRGLLASSKPGAVSAKGRRTFEDDDEENLLDIDAIKQKAGSSRTKSHEVDVNTRLFQAGIYSPDEKRRFLMFRTIAPIVGAILLGAVFGLATGSPLNLSMGIVGGAIAGYLLPLRRLDKMVKNRQEMTMYFLPLVIEQVSIGVSSSLDIGPCLAMLVNMANERGSHNPVTEMFVHVEKLMRSGLNLEEALIEVAEANGQHEIKHAFLFLAQCSKHGGEISKQLQELADAVMVQRQVQVEGKIAALPVKATGPLGCVFAGFFGLLFAGLVVRLMEAFGS